MPENVFQAFAFYKSDQKARASYYDIVTQNAWLLFESQMQGAGVSVITR
jgi:hypothetical protein